MKRSLAIISSIVMVSVALVAAEKFALRVNAGAEKAYKDKAGNDWKPAKEYIKGSGYGFVGGNTVDRGADVKIAGTQDARIYQTEQYGMESFKAEVPNGKYTVRLHFAETYDGITANGERVFDVKIQGKEVLKDFDVRKTAGGNEKAVVKEFKGVEVTDKLLVIGFTEKTQSPEINGIEIIAE
jgi:hypothetical protein